LNRKRLQYEEVLGTPKRSVCQEFDSERWVDGGGYLTKAVCKG